MNENSGRGISTGRAGKTTCMGCSKVGDHVAIMVCKKSFDLSRKTNKRYRSLPPDMEGHYSCMNDKEEYNVKILSYAVIREIKSSYTKVEK